MTPEEMNKKMADLNLNVEFHGELRRFCKIYRANGDIVGAEGSTYEEAFEKALKEYSNGKEVENETQNID